MIVAGIVYGWAGDYVAVVIAVGDSAAFYDTPLSVCYLVYMSRGNDVFTENYDKHHITQLGASRTVGTTPPHPCVTSLVGRWARRRWCGSRRSMTSRLMTSRSWLTGGRGAGGAVLAVPGDVTLAS